MTRGTSSGLVVLAGAGPGNGSLASLATIAALTSADTVIYDRLGTSGLLRHCRKDALLIPVGKTPGECGPTQDDINDLLVEHGRTGKLVVRLKGGDPFIFGRGGEEADALATAGIPFQIIPGITAAVAAGAYAGIPLTDRRLASTVAFVTGQQDPTKAGSTVNWRALAGIDTVVCYMGVGRLREIAGQLIAAGRDGATPAALVANATLPSQRVVTATLADIATVAESAGIAPPAVLIVGAVVTLRQNLAWLEKLPLWGKTVLITRPAEQAEDLAEPLRRLGAAAIAAPTVQILPPADEGAIDAVLRRLGEFDLVAFTSANGVASFVERAGRLGLDARAMPHSALAAIGPATAEALRRHFLRPDVLPTEFTTSALAAAIGEWMKTSRDAARFSPSTRAKNPDYIGTLPVAPNPDVTSVRRVLLARADIATPELAASLRAMTGVVVEEVSFYRTVPATELPAEAAEALRAGRVDWITFTSSSCVRGLLALAESQHLLGAVRSAKLAAIGPVTARTLRDAGLEPAFIASPHTVEGLVEGIVTNSPNDNSQ